MKRELVFRICQGYSKRFAHLNIVLLGKISKLPRLLLLASIILGTISCQLNKKNKKGYYYVPNTISPEAQKVLRDFDYKDTVGTFPVANDFKKWTAYWTFNENRWQPYNDTLISRYQPVLKDTILGGVPVIDVRSKNWKDNGKVLVYAHGGAYTLFSARTMLIGSVPVAEVTGLRVISINYTNPPNMKFMQIIEQVISVVKALLAQGYKLKDIGIYGDSAGGGLVAGSVLKMRDDGIGMPAVVVLISPWSDLTESGDSYHTLKDKDPIIAYGNSLGPSALAYAPIEDHKNPYVSPVYADYSKGFPPTLIQGGTKEIFLSNFVRQYQAIDQAGIPVKLDLYEGMWHVFQEINYDLPESIIAHNKMRDFVKLYLKY
jgi:epsilon-lactone hydrolase